MQYCCIVIEFLLILSIYLYLAEIKASCETFCIYIFRSHSFHWIILISIILLPCPAHSSPITQHTLPNIKQGESESQLSSLSLISFGEILQLATIIYILPTFAHFYQANISFTCCQIPGEIVKYLYFIATDKSNQQLLYSFQYLVFQKWFLYASFCWHLFPKRQNYILH